MSKPINRSELNQKQEHHWIECWESIVNSIMSECCLNTRLNILSMLASSLNKISNVHSTQTSIIHSTEDWR